MKCERCLKDVILHGPLGHCDQCGVWYKAEGEETEEVYRFCSSKGDPEKCDPFVKSLLVKSGVVPEGEEIDVPQTTLTNVHKADEICAECPNKNFV